LGPSARAGGRELVKIAPRKQSAAAGGGLPCPMRPLLGPAVEPVLRSADWRAGQGGRPCLMLPAGCPARDEKARPTTAASLRSRQRGRRKSARPAHSYEAVPDDPAGRRVDEYHRTPAKVQAQSVRNDLACKPKDGVISVLQHFGVTPLSTPNPPKPGDNHVNGNCGVAREPTTETGRLHNR
jgi:hypothetical protein